MARHRPHPFPSKRCLWRAALRSARRAPRPLTRDPPLHLALDRSFPHRARRLAPADEAARGGAADAPSGEQGRAAGAAAAAAASIARRRASLTVAHARARRSARLSTASSSAADDDAASSLSPLQSGRLRLAANGGGVEGDEAPTDATGLRSAQSSRRPSFGAPPSGGAGASPHGQSRLRPPAQQQQQQPDTVAEDWVLAIAELEANLAQVRLPSPHPPLCGCELLAPLRPALVGRTLASRCFPLRAARARSAAAERLTLARPLFICIC